MTAKYYKTVKLILFSYCPEKRGDGHSTCFGHLFDILCIVELEIKIPIPDFANFSSGFL